MQSREYIHHILQNYRAITATINMLKLELQNFKGITNEEALEALTYQVKLGDRVQTSGISDKTANLAAIYKEYTKRVNNESKSEIFNSLMPLEHEIKLLEAAVEGLSYQECDVIKELYFKNKTLPQVAGEHATSERSVRYIRGMAINRLVSIYNRYHKTSKWGTKNENT